jgi:hypothetical protein
LWKCQFGTHHHISWHEIWWNVERGRNCHISCHEISWNIHIYESQYHTAWDIAKVPIWNPTHGILCHEILWYVERVWIMIYHWMRYRKSANLEPIATSHVTRYRETSTWYELWYCAAWDIVKVVIWNLSPYLMSEDIAKCQKHMNHDISWNNTFCVVVDKSWVCSANLSQPPTPAVAQNSLYNVTVFFLLCDVGATHCVWSMFQSVWQ